MSRLRIGIEIVWADLKVHQMQCIEGRWLDDGHVFGRLQRRTGHNRPSARSDERNSLIDPFANRLQQIVVIEGLQQAKGVPASNEDRFCCIYEFPMIGV